MVHVEELDKLIDEWRILHTKDGTDKKMKKFRIKDLRLKFLEFMGDRQLVILEKVVFQRQYHEKYETVAVWDKDKWNQMEQRRAEWEQNNLNWIN